MVNSAPVKIYNRKVFIGSGPYVLTVTTEPIPVAGFQKMDLAWTIHGISPSTKVTLQLQHASEPETSQSENWSNLGASVQLEQSVLGGLQLQGRTSQISATGFLPFIRAKLTAQPEVGGSSGIIAFETSIVGHLHRDTG